MKKYGLIIFLIFFTGCSFFIIFQNHSMKMTASVIQENMVRDIDTTTVPISKIQYESLPAPVSRYLHYALGNKSKMDISVQYKQAGWIQINLKEKFYDHPNWKYVVAESRVRLDQPAFFWQTLIHLGCEFWLKGWYWFDSLNTELYLTWMGVIPLIQHHDPELQQNALGQFLMQLPWMPTAMLPSEYLEWEAIDDTSAQARISIGRNKLTGFFHFDSTGKIIRFITNDMRRMTNSGYIHESRMVKYDQYEQFMNMQVPARLYFFWNTPAGWMSDADFRLDEIVYH